MCTVLCIYSHFLCDKKAIRCAGLRVGIFCFRAVMKKPHFAQGFVCEKATLRARLRVALKFLKLTAFVNEILWWAHRDSNPGPTD